MWERACSRRRTDIQHRCRLIHRIREQARSHILIAFQAGMDCSSATPAPISPEYGAVTSHTGMPLK
ncbi:hypothetical protein ELQ88_27560 [Pseudomonas sp. MPC6]|nr:hypothetical protein ELQ88_27560 [Pseudomonas sp. MPC6]